ncbi:putative malate/L-lact (ISS) protein, partial [Corchorus olitorius]
VCQLVLIDVDAQAGAGWHLQHEVAVLQRFGQQFLREQQRAEQLGAELQLAKGGKHMGRCGRADRAFEHRSAVQADARQLRDGCHLHRRHKAAGLRDLHGEDIGTGRARQLKRVERTVQGFVSHHRHRELAGQALQRGAVFCAHRLLDQVDAPGLQRGDAVGSVQLAPGLVDVYTHTHDVAQRALDGQYVGHIVCHRAQTGSSA